MPAAGGGRRQVYPIGLSRTDLYKRPGTVLLTGGTGAVCQYPAMPGTLDSKYDTLLSVAYDPQHPEHRISLVRHLRETVQVGPKWFDLDESFLRHVTVRPHPTWVFHYDDGEHRIVLERTFIMPRDRRELLIRYRCWNPTARCT